MPKVIRNKYCSCRRSKQDEYNLNEVDKRLKAIVKEIQNDV